MRRLPIARITLVLVAVALLAGVMPGRAADPAQGIDMKVFEKTVSKAIDYLAKNQAADGSFSKQAGPAVTALVATAIMRNGRPVPLEQAPKLLSTWVSRSGRFAFHGAAVPPAAKAMSCDELVLEALRMYDEANKA